MLSEQEIVERFLATRLQVHPDVLSYLREKNDPALVDRIIAGVPPETLVVSTRHLPDLHRERDGARFAADPSVELISGAAGTAGSTNRFEDFFQYFRDRYTRLSEMIRTRTTAIPIEALVKTTRYRQQEAAAIGMVMDVRTTGRGNRLVELEDPTGQITVLFNHDRPVFADAERILPDEVIGVRGKLSENGRFFYAEQLFRPDVPVSHAPFTSDREGKAVFISDIHVGSNTFLEGEWKRFAEWLPESGASYLLVCGDLVDGIGIYPGQQDELTIRDIYGQYERLGQLLAEVPPEIRIILSPGNHDVVRGAEPQPALPEEFTKGYPKNVTRVENPCLLSLQGVRVLMYHGRSIDDMIGMIPGASYSHPEQMMVEMLQRRHLAPTYGKKTPISAERQDRMVISPVPEILHTGHIHTCGLTRYRGVLGINAGTWQSQTAFQRQMNINPTPARAVVVDLRTLEPRIMEFLQAA